VFDNLVFTKAAFWKIDQFRHSTGDKLVDGEQVTFEAEDCIDRKGRCRLIVDVYEGRSRNKVDEYLPPQESQPEISGVAVSNTSGEEPDNIPF
jgi:hypothetical protein